jgi:hypothetical protein
MLEALEVVAVLLLAVVVAQSLAHALEYPGKMRLSKEEYLAVQPIYYPGFTVAGAAEPAGIAALIALLFFIPAGTAFWLTLCALILLAGTHATYWLMTHPVNNFWLENTEMEGAGKAFFGSDPLRRKTPRTGKPDWIALRDRWERSHLIRAVLAFASLGLLAVAVTS